MFQFQCSVAAFDGQQGLRKRIRIPVTLVGDVDYTGCAAHMAEHDGRHVLAFDAGVDPCVTRIDSLHLAEKHPGQVENMDAQTPVMTTASPWSGLATMPESC